MVVAFHGRKADEEQTETVRLSNCKGKQHINHRNISVINAPLYGGQQVMNTRRTKCHACQKTLLIYTLNASVEGIDLTPLPDDTPNNDHLVKNSSDVHSECEHIGN